MLHGELICVDGGGIFHTVGIQCHLRLHVSPTLFVVNVETLVTRDGTSRRLITLDNGYKLLEGVGCLNSQGMFFFYLNPKLSYYNQKAFLVDYLDDIFSGNDIYKIDYYYDVDALIIGSTTVKNLKTPTLFDLQGRRLQGKPQRGMYIRDGRKYVVK